MTAAAMALDTVADESRKKMADGVARSPSRLCSRDGNICCYGNAFSTIFLLACFYLYLASSYFSFFFCFFSSFFLHPGMFIFLVSLRLCSSHMLLSASTYVIVRVLSACVICTLPHLGILLFFYSSSIFFRSSYFSGGVFFSCALVPGTLELDLPTLILQRLVFLCLCDQIICISLG